MRPGRDSRGRHRHPVAARPRPSVVAGQACPKGIAFVEIQNDPDRVLHPLKRNAAGRVRAGDLGVRSGRHRRQAAEAPARLDRWLPGQPAGLLLLPLGLVHRVLRALGTKHSYSAGSQDINSRFAASALLYGSVTPAAVPRPAPHRLPDDHRRQPARLARQRPERAPDQGPARRHHQAGRPRRRGRPAAHRDRPRVRARPGAARRRRLAAAVDAARDLRRGAGRRRRDHASRPPASTPSAPRPPSTRRSRPSASPAWPPTTYDAWRATSRRHRARRRTAAPARAWAGTRRWSVR